MNLGNDLQSSFATDATLLHRVEADDADWLIDELLTVRGMSLENELLRMQIRDTDGDHE